MTPCHRALARGLCKNDAATATTHRSRSYDACIRAMAKQQPRRSQGIVAIVAISDQADFSSNTSHSYTIFGNINARFSSGATLAPHIHESHGTADTIPFHEQINSTHMNDQHRMLCATHL